LELSRTVAPDCEIDVIGMRPGEKTHEILVSEDEARYTVELDDKFVILPAGFEQATKRWKDGRPLSAGFRYGSDTNTQQLTPKTLTGLLAPLGSPQRARSRAREPGGPGRRCPRGGGSGWIGLTWTGWWGRSARPGSRPPPLSRISKPLSPRPAGLRTP